MICSGRARPKGQQAASGPPVVVVVVGRSGRLVVDGGWGAPEDTLAGGSPRKAVHRTDTQYSSQAASADSKG